MCEESNLMYIQSEKTMDKMKTTSFEGFPSVNLLERIPLPLQQDDDTKAAAPPFQ